MTAQNQRRENADVHFMMNMPQWYMNLPDEEKVVLAKKYAEKSPNDRELSQEEIADLLKVSD